VTLLSCRVLSHPVASCPVVSCRVLSCPVVSCRVLSCPVVSCRVLSCRDADVLSVVAAAGSVSASPSSASPEPKDSTRMSIFNLYRSLLHSLTSDADFAFVFKGLSRLLNNVPQADSTYLPYSTKQVCVTCRSSCVASCRVESWPLCDLACDPPCAVCDVTGWLLPRDSGAAVEVSG
jgi:hypothetical protein